MAMRNKLAFALVIISVIFSLFGTAVLLGFPGLEPIGPVTSILDENADNRGSDIRFVEVSAEKGLNYTYVREPGVEESTTNAGIYAVDYDNDDWIDLLAIGGSTPILYENNGGEFRRSAALPAVNGSFQGALFFDHDNDGWEDLLLLRWNESPLFLENDAGRFESVSVGFDESLSIPIGATAIDYDNDGCLDVFVIQNGDWRGGIPHGLRDYSVPDGSDNGHPNYLYRSDCTSFVDATPEAGITGNRWSLATSAVDFDNDGRPDIHVANDFNHDVLYSNRGNGSFERRILSNRTNRNGMSSELTDINRDGRIDIFVTNIYFPRYVEERTERFANIRSRGNNLLVNQGNGTFVDRADEYNVVEGGWGWAAVMVDFDNDGDEDLMHTASYITFDAPNFDASYRQYIREEFPYFHKPLLWEQTDDRFDPLNATEAGFTTSNGRGAAALDYDNDGDVDVVVANAAGSYQLYENVRGDGEALQIQFQDEGASRGARVFVSVPDGEEHLQVLSSHSDFLSQDARVMHFGLGNEGKADVRVVWPDGTERKFANVTAGQRVIVARSGIKRRIPLDD